MVDAINPISATAGTAPTRVGSSSSIGSEPDNAWVAARQSHITADLLKRGREAHREEEAADGAEPEEEADRDIPGLPHPDPQHHAHGGEPHREPRDRDGDAETADGDHPEDHLLSGESERIGSVNFDDETPFGHRTAII